MSPSSGLPTTPVAGAASAGLQGASRPSIADGLGTPCGRRIAGRRIAVAAAAATSQATAPSRRRRHRAQIPGAAAASSSSGRSSSGTASTILPRAPGADPALLEPSSRIARLVQSSPLSSRRPVPPPTRSRRRAACSAAPLPRRLRVTPLPPTAWCAAPPAASGTSRRASTRRRWSRPIARPPTSKAAPAPAIRATSHRSRRCAAPFAACCGRCSGWE